MDSLVVQNAIVYMFAGLTMRGLSDGHWIEFTKPVENFAAKLACRLISWVMFYYGFMGLCGLVMGPAWAMFLTFSIALGWIHYRGEL